MAEKTSSRQRPDFRDITSDNGGEARANRVPFWRQVWDPTGLTPSVVDHSYAGAGTAEDPYIVTWIPSDPRNPMLYPASTRWSVMMVVAMCALMVSLCSSAYSGGRDGIVREFDASEELYTLGISLFVLGFAVGYVMSNMQTKLRSTIDGTDRRQTSHLGSLVRAIRAPTSFPRHLRSADGFQRRRSRRAEHLDLTDPAIFRRCNRVKFPG